MFPDSSQSQNDCFTVSGQAHSYIRIMHWYECDNTANLVCAETKPGTSTEHLDTRQNASFPGKLLKRSLFLTTIIKSLIKSVLSVGETAFQ